MFSDVRHVTFGGNTEARIPRHTRGDYNKVVIVTAMKEGTKALRGNPLFEQLKDHLSIVKSGVGKVNAAIAVEGQRRFQPRCVINIGTAGALDQKLELGDIVIGEDSLQHDVDVTALGFQRGQVPFETEHIWNGDTNLLAKAAHICESLKQTHHQGRILTGDRFVTDPQEITTLCTVLNGSCVDMETAAIAKACSSWPIHTPFISILGVSNTHSKQAQQEFNCLLDAISMLVADTALKLARSVIAA